MRRDLHFAAVRRLSGIMKAIRHLKISAPGSSIRASICSFTAFFAVSATAVSSAPAEAASESQVADLGAVLVEGGALSKYRPETVESGTFTAMAPERLPIVVDTLTEDFIREHNPTDLHDLLRFVPGVETGGKSLLIRQPGTFSIRGMGGTEPTFEGAFPIGRGPGLFMDPFLMDRIEIAKGPVGALAGGAGTQQNASGAGGSVAMYLKGANLDGDAASMQENASVGRDVRRFRAMIDANEMLGGGSSAVRAVATADWYQPAWIENGSQNGADARESYALAPSAIWSVDDLTFGVKSLFQYAEQPSYIGIPVWRGKPGGGYSWFESSCRPDDRSSYKSFVFLPWAELRATDEWTVRAGGAAMVSSWDQTTREPYTPGLNTPEFAEYLRSGMWPSGEKYMVSGFSQSHSVTRNFGGYLRAVHDREFSESLRNVFLVQPDASWREATSGFGTPTWRAGLTAQDSVEKGPVAVLAGLRLDRFDQKSYAVAGARGAPSVRYPKIAAEALSPRVGASVEAVDGLVFFGNVSQTRTPMLGLRGADGSTPDDPWRATQCEGGVRVRPAESLWLTLTGYSIEQENVPEFDNTGLVLDTDGRNASRGAEVSLSGDIDERWTILAMYSFNRYENRNAPRGSRARSFERVPRHSFSLSVSHEIWGGPLEGVVFGGGFRLRSKSYATMRGAFVDENLYFSRSCVFDVNAAIPFSVFGGSADWALSLGVRNLFDERYFESSRHYYECLVGEPRTFEIGLRARF